VEVAILEEGISAVEAVATLAVEAMEGDRII
jgi:hypothetical protein